MTNRYQVKAIIFQVIADFSLKRKTFLYKRIFEIFETAMFSSVFQKILSFQKTQYYPLI